MQPLDSMRPTVRSLSLPLPKELFGSCSKPLKRINCVIVNLLETMSEMLLNPDVVGGKVQNFKYRYTPEYNDAGEQTFGNVTSGTWFKKTEKAIQLRWGRSVYLLAFAISCDKTHVDRVGGISVWPCYITILNLNSTVRRTARGSDIVGYLPILPYSDTELEQILRKYCGVLRKIDEVVKMTKLYMEQSFYFNLLKPVRDCEENGPISLQVGPDRDNVFAFVPKMMVYICKFRVTIHYIFHLQT